MDFFDRDIENAVDPADLVGNHGVEIAKILVEAGGGVGNIDFPVARVTAE